MPTGDDWGGADAMKTSAIDKERAVSDAYPPSEIARNAEQLGVAKAQMDVVTLLILAILAGGFISLGALFSIVAVTESGLGLGPTRLLGGLSFCLGLILVLVAGAELFTGNNLIAMAWASGVITTRQVLRNWLLVYLGNAAGCIGTVGLVLWAGIDTLGGGAIGETAIAVAYAKVELPFGTAFARGILCNALVCLAAWLALGGRSVVDKIVAILAPVTAFVTIGFEHSIANWFLLPWGLALDGQGGAMSMAAIGRNLVAVTAGNIVGGTLLVAGVYWIAYRRAHRVGNARL